MRPVSIVQFERCYLGAILIGLVNSLILLPRMFSAPQTAQAVATFGPGLLYVSLAIGILVPLLLWYFR